ncbi:transmembrane channel-like protein 6 [Bicyclus anynana]|uniref:Transmembrane channel-like protein 6 n=1 Tax=Bicyclus anynana TaxID=110368 RepID=A0A6J1MWN6_BICAN|nr:transmembrane channel-like protein 6 [Bicyclus anynana]
MEEEVESIEMNTSSARRAYTLRNNVARQVAVNFMPSRQIAHNTLRLRRVNSEHNALLDALVDAPDAADAQADIIVREMEQHQSLMEDNPVSEELRREALRDLPQCLTMKRNVRAKLSASVSLRSKRRPISFLKRLKYRISFAWKRTRDKFRDFIFSIELWYEAIRNIEGHLGSAVGSYFHLLRWLFGLNLLLTTFLLCFVVVPQALHDQAGNGTTELGALDFISGRGGLEHTLLFYGHYHDAEIASPGPLRYYMPFAYFYTMFCLYLMFFAVLCYRTAYSYRRNFIEPSGGTGALSQLLAAKLFCGWDFGIASPAGAALAAHALYLEFKELLNEQNRKKMITSAWVRVWQRLANVLVTVLALAIIAGILYGLWLLLAVEELTENREIYISLAITAVVSLCPVLLHFIVKLEYYEARTAFYVTLARTWLLDIGILVILLIYWSRSDDECWETRVGQEGYRLVILDVLVSLLLIPTVELVRGMLFKWKVLEAAPEFDITYNSLTLIYNQSVLWLGMLFSPLLVVAVTAKFLLLFYVKRESALRMCHTGKKVWRAAQTQTVLYMLVTLSLFTMLFAIGSVFLRSSSVSCGPFRQYEHVFAIVSEGLLQLSRHHTLRAVLHFIVRPGPIAFVLLGLCVCVYIMRARAAAQRSMAAILRQMLRLQAKDKDFLLNAIEKVSNGEWLYSPKAEEYGEDSHTWKYLNEVRKPSNAGFHFDGSRLSHSFLERPKSYVKENRPTSYHTERPKSLEDGDTDSSFSWQGSSSYLNQKGEAEEKR